MSDSSYNDGSPESSEPDFAFGIDDRAREWPSAPAAAAVDWFHLADRLSRLGTLLWLHRNGSSDGAFPRARLLPRGVLLLDHPALNAFSLGFPLKIMLTVVLSTIVFIALPGVVSGLTDTAVKTMLGVGR